MVTQTATVNRPKQDLVVEQKIQKLRDVICRRAADREDGAGEQGPRPDVAHIGSRQSRMESAGRTGSRQGTVSELTLMLTFAPGGARRLRAVAAGAIMAAWTTRTRSAPFTTCASCIFDNDTKMLFATAYTGTGTRISTTSRRRSPTSWTSPLSAFEGWPGIHSPEVKDWIANHQIPAEGLVRRPSGSDGGGD